MTVMTEFKGNNVFIIFSRRSSRVAGLEQQEETAGDSIRVRVCPRIPIRHIFCLLPAGPRNTAPFPDARVLQGTKIPFLVLDGTTKADYSPHSIPNMFALTFSLIILYISWRA